MKISELIENLQEEKSTWIENQEVVIWDPKGDPLVCLGAYYYDGIINIGTEDWYAHHGRKKPMTDREYLASLGEPDFLDRDGNRCWLIPTEDPDYVDDGSSGKWDILTVGVDAL